MEVRPICACLRFRVGTAGMEHERGKGFAFTVIWSDSAARTVQNCAYVRLSKNSDYLIDNLCVLMLSKLKGEVKKKVDRLCRFPELESDATLFAKGLGPPISGSPKKSYGV